MRCCMCGYGAAGSISHVSVYRIPASVFDTLLEPYGTNLRAWVLEKLHFFIISTSKSGSPDFVFSKILSEISKGDF